MRLETIIAVVYHGVVIKKIPYPTSTKNVLTIKTCAAIN